MSTYALAVMLQNKKEWEKSMHKLLHIYRHIGLDEREVLEYIGMELGYDVINLKGKPIQFKLRRYACQKQ